MLSGERNQNGEKKNNRSNQQKTTLHVQHIFLVHFFAIVLHDHNVKIPETSQLHVLWRKCRTCCCSILFTRSFLLWWPLGFLLFSLPLKIFMLFFQQIAPYLPLQLSVAFFLVEIRRPVAHFIFSLYSKFVDMTINLTLDNKDTETISAFRFPLY